MSQYGYTSLSDSKPVARKKHKCSWCGEAILPNEQYERSSGIYYGEFQTNKFHNECAEACTEAARDWGFDFEFEPYRNKRGSTEEA